MAKTRGKIIREATSIRLAFSMGCFLFCGVSVDEEELNTDFDFFSAGKQRDVKSVTDDCGRKTERPLEPNGFCNQKPLCFHHKTQTQLGLTHEKYRLVVHTQVLFSSAGYEKLAEISCHFHCNSLQMSKKRLLKA